MATQYFKRNLLLLLYIEKYIYSYFVSCCHLRGIKMSDTCRVFFPFGDPWSSCLLASHHELQPTRPPCASPTSRVYPNPCPLSRLCHPTISSSVIPFSSCHQSFSAARSFPMSQLFPWGSQAYWSLSSSISPSNEHPGLISFRMDWLDLLAVQGTLKILLQHQSSKASILQRSAFFTVQLSNPYITNGKTIALTRWIFVGKVMSLLLNRLSR